MQAPAAMIFPYATMSPPLSPTTSPKAVSSPQRTGSTGSNTSSSSSSARSALSLDLSDIPPLVQPSPPSNTLILTNLNDPNIFQPHTLQRIRGLVSARHTLNSFAPIKSFRRIIISYSDNAAAIATRQLLDGTTTRVFLPPNPDASDSATTTPIYDRIRCYFGEPTPVLGEYSPDRHLKAPNPGKLFFISPPPSPPCGWEVREEDPPNKDTHAEDLQRALANLSSASVSDDGSADPDAIDFMDVDVSPEDGEETEGSDIESRRLTKRKRAKSTTVYHPRDHGSKEDLPAVIVSDMGAEEEEESELGNLNETTMRGLASTMGAVITHTSRPPVELMQE